MDLRFQLRLRAHQRGVPHLSLPHIQVACGALRDPDGRVLIVERPAGKIAAGKWEFPGGKIEAGETPRAALVRELHEEIGIQVREARPLLLFTHAYWDRIVTLHSWLVAGWDGTPHPHEGQRFFWHRPGTPPALDVLPTVQPILRALELPEDYVFTPPDADEGFIRTRLPALPAGALLRLRLPALDERAYAALAARVIGDARALGLRVLLDRGAAMARDLGAAGLHLREAQLAGAADGAADDDGLLRVASCHDADALRRARELGCDAAVLGSVQATATHPGAAPLGWSGYARLAPDCGLPVYAIGGLGPADKPAAFEAYAQGVAGISAYWHRRGG